MRHNELKNDIGYLAECAVSPSNVCDEPVIYVWQGREERNGTDDEIRNDHGDIMVICIWESETECIIDVLISNIYSS